VRNGLVVAIDGCRCRRVSGAELPQSSVSLPVRSPRCT
jgi:hypothetical protein